MIESGDPMAGGGGRVGAEKNYVSHKSHQCHLWKGHLEKTRIWVGEGVQVNGGVIRSLPLDI